MSYILRMGREIKMPMIKCPECGKDVSDLASSCPNCGFPLGFDSPRNNSPNQNIPNNNVYTYNTPQKPTKMKQSTLSTWAAICAFFTCTMPIGVILAIIDLKKKDETTKHTGSWFAIIFGALLVILLFIGGIGKSNDTPRRVENTTINNTEENSSTATVAGSKENIFKIGETAELNNIQVTMIDCKESLGGEYNKPSDGNVFLLVQFEICNNSDSEIGVSSMLSFEAYADDYVLDYSLNAMIDNDENQLDGSIASGKKMKGWIGWEVPNDYKEVEIHFTDNVWTNNKFKFLIEK